MKEAISRPRVTSAVSPSIKAPDSRKPRIPPVNNKRTKLCGENRVGCACKEKLFQKARETGSERGWPSPGSNPTWRKAIGVMCPMLNLKQQDRCPCFFQWLPPAAGDRPRLPIKG